MKSLGLCTTTFFLLWLLVLFFTSPSELGMIAFLLFYTLFFLMITGAAGLGFMYLGVRSQKSPISATGISTTLRQGGLIGVLLTVTLLFQQFNIFAWWVGLLILLAVFVVELYFLSRANH